ncbi:hypothetical protein LMG31841_01169 [Paraburkholderia saeva]|uniref:RES domain-containing protein n=1 Tax=Paraburkholderia saeva TaxID=2777537 RepID=A0A9N8RT72_9BURK|nr:hypothetical protein LMG31841_01169 [Paraburkholderia saeva]CAG4914381.1 hypothetical protein R70241_04232 [Paraburkholderia saeva]
MVSTLTQTFPPLPLEELLCEISTFQEKPFVEKQALIRRLVDAHPILSLTWGPGHSYRRARRLHAGESLPSEVDGVIWRKDIPAKAGRANAAGFPVLYLADNAETAFSEVGISDDQVVLAEFEIQPNKTVQIAPIGEMRQIQRTGRGALSGGGSRAISDLLNACGVEEARSLLIADAFLYDCLMNPDDDYSVSSLVAMNIFGKLPDVSVIAYPSRRQTGALNFAVRVEGFWDRWGVSAVRCGRAVHLKYGYFRFHDVRHVVGITVSGSMRWDNNIVVPSLSNVLRPLWRPRVDA